ncbi:MAG TPA: phosphoglucosamine mutase [Bryobacteraceae bacterium]|nr:phosphoglucosamine mutase [Bryobacteraceae bacterium]
MAKRLFGTDGIRGVAGMAPLDPPTVTALGIALGDDLTRRNRGNRPVLIGMDTRESGPAIAAQMAAGLARAGVRAEFAGVVTTPGVAYLTRTAGYAAGVMISASHNPFEDNGIKIFARTGFKLPDDEEHEIEEEIFRLLPTLKVRPQPPDLIQTVSPAPYTEALLRTLPVRLDGIHVVLDCGNGAAWQLAPALFRAAGATVTAIFDTPNGRNINLNCGALHLEALRAKVLESGADAGIAFDGDADRALMVAGSGRVVDGDAILLIAGRLLQKSGHLPGNIVVATVMSNLGLEKAFGSLGITMLRTPVGDKYVLEEMVRCGAPLGGEQSGHIIFSEHATTGDGMLTGLSVLAACVSEGSSLDTLAAGFTVYPQILVNVRVKERVPLAELPGVSAEIASCEREMAGSGRVLVRYSGTEPLLRVMVEGSEQGKIEQVAGRITSAIRAELG